ncbi:MAG TPA: threonine dehydratase [Pyrinomonadaceae bacterium]|nr:threonine dehydratase [Pyrinomonadaceae bacterium]
MSDAAAGMKSWRLPDLRELKDSADLVSRYVPITPQFRWPLLSSQAGCELWIKHENHTPTGSFKMRGGLVYLDWLRKSRPEVTGVVTATRGNHGQSIAFAARQFGLSAVIVVPHGNSREKNEAMRALGAELIEHGESFHDADRHAEDIAGSSELFRVPSFDPLLVRGVGTYALELFEAVPQLDCVYVPVGWGSGACGLAAARNALGLRTRIIGVVSSQAPSFARSITKGEIVEVPAATRIADGIAIAHPHPGAFDLVRHEIDRMVEVSDQAVEAAMRIYFSCTHNVAEGAGAASLAAIFQEGELVAGKQVAAILSGGNVDTGVYGRVLAATPPAP